MTDVQQEFKRQGSDRGSSPPRLARVSMQRHPCPRRLHHPSEKCSCAFRLALGVPQGYCKAGDAGAIHAARAHNLRWRLPGAGHLPEAAFDISARSSGGFEIDMEPISLPPSLRLLVEDFQGGAATRAIRPLSPRKRPGAYQPHGGDGPDRRGVALAKARQPQLTAVTTEDSLKVHAGRVAFRAEAFLAAEVPVLLGASARLEPVLARPGTPCRSRCSSPRTTNWKERERHSRANLERLVANHNKVVSFSCAGCFDFLPMFTGPVDTPPRKVATGSPRRIASSSPQRC
mmetsp:Transcript_53576/g.154479  ORF Transcript_53576/g.154479 Transcript_53576/m.154479 type:complete len:288 (+) Transcript_53576:57-920(+)